ncbi:hypothetical protein [uncultured Methanofollis sp.]|uniref:hypothetical protein n=1 Tax=uncultured Methanofollis sp. TaxID=262500 RepID=UPI0026175A12|nr:hypothetical protein [uncultured Methanofollis sp.]
MLNKDAKVKFLEHQLEEREREIVSMRDSEKTFASPEDERIYRLEQRLKEMEALVKGLTEEVLDLKTVTMRLNRAFEAKTELERAERPSLKPKVFVEELPERQEDFVRGSAPTPAPAPTSVSTGDEGDMDLIMQNDGTLKRERRRSSDYIIAPNNQAPACLTSERRSGSRRNTEKRAGAIIFAEEEDDTSIRK